MATSVASASRPRAEPGLASAIHRQLRDHLGDPPGQLGNAAEHAIASAGKLLRPKLMLEACRAVGGNPAVALHAAVGTELGHIASLVHDDIIDGDGVRRGRPALHSAFGVPLAILTGDLLVFEMFAAYAECAQAGVGADRALRAIEILSQTCIDVCRGQALEAELTAQVNVSEAAYLEVIRLKTAGVCRAATEIGATLGGGSDTAIAALREYGEALGMAFQMVDDLLEYTGKASLVGKPLDSDLRNGRMTLPLIYALSDADSATSGCILKLLSEDGNPHRHGALAEVLERNGALARTRDTAARFTERALNELEVLAPSASRDRLRAFAIQLLDRDR